MKKGFTLIELLAVIAILAIIMLIAAPRILDAIESSRINAYQQNEQMMVKATETYFGNNVDQLPENVGDTVEVTLSDLKTNDLIGEVSDSAGSCEGYILVTKTEEGYSYNPQLKCGASNIISNTTDDNLFLHYTFDDYQEATKNLLNGRIDLSFEDQTLSGWSGSLFLTDEKLFNNHKVYRMNLSSSSATISFTDANEYVPADTYVSYSYYIYIPEEVDLTSEVELHIHARPDGECLDGSCHHYDFVDSSNSKINHTSPKGEWLRKTVIVKTHNDDPLVNGYLMRLHWYNTAPNAAGGYIYMTEPQIEVKDHVTPFTNSERLPYIKDYSINTNEAQLKTDITPKWIYDEDVKSGVYEFDGIDDYIEIPHYNTGDEKTITTWIKTSTAYGNQIIIGDLNTAALGFYNTNYLIGSGVVMKPIADLNGTFKENEWNQLTVAYSSTSIEYYCNGIKLTTSSDNNWSWSLSPSAYIGRRTPENSNPYYFKGRMDDIKIYDRKLSEDEIKYQYDTQKSIYK